MNIHSATIAELGFQAGQRICMHNQKQPVDFYDSKRVWRSKSVAMDLRIGSNFTLNRRLSTLHLPNRRFCPKVELGMYSRGRAYVIARSFFWRDVRKEKKQYANQRLSALLNLGIKLFLVTQHGRISMLKTLLDGKPVLLDQTGPGLLGVYGGSNSLMHAIGGSNNETKERRLNRFQDILVSCLLVATLGLVLAILIQVGAKAPYPSIFELVKCLVWLGVLLGSVVFSAWMIRSTTVHVRNLWKPVSSSFSKDFIGNAACTNNSLRCSRIDGVNLKSLALVGFVVSFIFFPASWNPKNAYERIASSIGMAKATKWQQIKGTGTHVFGSRGKGHR